MNQTMPEAFDRRQANRDAADWVQAALDRQETNIVAARAEIVIGLQEVGKEMRTIEDKVDELQAIVLRSYNGSPDEHRHAHDVLAEKCAEEADAAKDRKEGWRKIKWAVIGTMVASALAGFGMLMSYGAVEIFRTKVQEVAEGKSTSELRHIK